MEIKIAKRSLILHFMNLQLLHLLVVAFLTTHTGMLVYADSNELHENLNPVQDIDNFDVGTSDVRDKWKHSWKSLQGSWAKRSNEATVLYDDYDSEQPEWNLVKPSESSNENILEPKSEPEAMKYYVLYATNPNILATTVGAATSMGNLKDLADMESSVSSNFEKKNWKNMNMAWGKRRSAVWNKFRGAWGKREPAWNNLKGMWGKRSTKDWKKLQSAWGKRSQQQQANKL